MRRMSEVPPQRRSDVKTPSFYTYFFCGARIFMQNAKNGRIKVRLKFLRQAALLYGLAAPAGATAAAAGVDLRADLEGEEISLAPGERQMLPTGIAIEPEEEGVAAFVYARSGLGGVSGLTVAQGVGVIDPDYRGEIKVPLLNTGRETRRLRKGDRIAQLIFQPFYRAHFTLVEELGGTERGEGGFGHTGRG
jgi:dUTP pyrophosphatase